MGFSEVAEVPVVRPVGYDFDVTPVTDVPVEPEAGVEPLCWGLPDVTPEEGCGVVTSIDSLVDALGVVVVVYSVTTVILVLLDLTVVVVTTPFVVYTNVVDLPSYSQPRSWKQNPALEFPFHFVTMTLTIFASITFSFGKKCVLSSELAVLPVSSSCFSFLLILTENVSN